MFVSIIRFMQFNLLALFVVNFSYAEDQKKYQIDTAEFNAVLENTQRLKESTKISIKKLEQAAKKNSKIVPRFMALKVTPALPQAEIAELEHQRGGWKKQYYYADSRMREVRSSHAFFHWSAKREDAEQKYSNLTQAIDEGSISKKEITELSLAQGKCFKKQFEKLTESLKRAKNLAFIKAMKVDQLEMSLNYYDSIHDDVRLKSDIIIYNSTILRIDFNMVGERCRIEGTDQFFIRAILAHKRNLRNLKYAKEAKADEAKIAAQIVKSVENAMQALNGSDVDLPGKVHREEFAITKPVNSNARNRDPSSLEKLVPIGAR